MKNRVDHRQFEEWIVEGTKARRVRSKLNERPLRFRDHVEELATPTAVELCSEIAKVGDPLLASDFERVNAGVVSKDRVEVMIES